MNQSGSGKALRILFATLIGLAIGFALLVRSAYSAPAPGEEISLNRLYALAEQGRIKQATLLDEDAVVVGQGCPSATSCRKPITFHASYPGSDVSTQALIERLATKGTDVIVDKQAGTAVAKLVITFVLPLALLANLFGIIFLWRGGESSISEIAGFGSMNKKRRQKKAEGGVRFANVAGADDAVAEMREVTDYLKDPSRFQAFGAAPPKGVLVFGPPGCGKTLLARATAGESNVPFFSVSGTEFVESLVGVGAARVRDLFRQVREVAPAIVFIDEIDAVGRRRSGEGVSGGEREQTLNQLLVEMDGFEVSAGIVVMGATNRPDILDTALMRPGRFDRHVTLLPPDVDGRRQILELHANARPLASDVDFSLLAKRTPGFTGADLANVVNEAALLTLRQNQGAQIGMAQLSEAVQRVLHGPQRRGHLLTADERRRLAAHEAGHAVVAAALGHQQDVHRVSIIARGKALAQAMSSGDQDRALLSSEEMHAALAVAMGGVAAEVAAVGSCSTAAEDDIAHATDLARQMVGRYGMSETIGRLRLLSVNGGYLDMGEATVDPVSGPTMASFDAEVSRLIREAEETASQVIEHHWSRVEEMARALQEEETLEGAALSRFLSGVRDERELVLAGAGTGAGSSGKAASRKR